MLKLLPIALLATLAISCSSLPPEDLSLSSSSAGGDSFSDLDIFAVDISQETEEWNYMVVAKDGSSMFIDVDESNDIPTRIFLKPDKNSDNGFSIFFKEDGLPDKMVVDGHILYFGNFTGYKYDLAIIYPDNRIEYHYDIETDVNWDAYREAPQARLMLLRFSSSFFSNFFSNPITKSIISIGMPIATCGVAPYFPIAATACASGIIKFAVETVFDGFTEDAGKALVDVMFCASGSKLTLSCVSGLINSVSLLSHIDFNLTVEKTTQINEAIRKLDGDVLTEIPRELLEYFYDLGITINSGRNPPNIEGTYSVSTLTLMRNSTTGSIATQWDKYVSFSRQNYTSLTVNVEYTMQTDNGTMSIRGLGYIVGDGNKYTIIVNGTREQGGYTAKTVEAFSGEITAIGITNYQWAVFMIDDSGDPLDHWIENGTGYSKTGTAVKFDPNQPGFVNNPIPLSADIWRTDSITSGLKEMWYSFNVESGTSYRIWWSDSDEGNGSHTLDILASAQYENGTSIFSGIDFGYSTPKTFTANQTGIVKIRVYPYSSGKTGTYALTYSVGSTAIRPLAKIAIFSEKKLPVNQVQGIKEASSQTVPSGARH